MLIYERSWLNISVSGSEVVAGCLLERNPRLSRRAKLPAAVSAFLYSNQNDEKGVYAHLDPSFYAMSMNDGFLSKRGWVLQERILSPRTVFFGKEEIYWECSDMTASESYPWGFLSKSHWPSIKFRSPNGLPIFHSNITPESRFEHLFMYWRTLVETFSQLRLTYGSDKLPAILGLAQALHKSYVYIGIFSQEYCNGQWIRDLHRSLLWYAVSPRKSPCTQTQSVSSWSWASHDGPVKFLPMEWQPHRYDENELEIHDVDASIKQSVPKTYIAGSPILELAYVTRMKVPNLAKSVPANCDLCLHIYGFLTYGTVNPFLNILQTPVRDVTARFMLDTASDYSQISSDYLAISKQDVYCLRTIKQHTNDNVYSVNLNGLLLIPVGSPSDLVFRRIGVVLEPLTRYWAPAYVRSTYWASAGVAYVSIV